MKKILILLILLPVIAFAQEDSKEDVWASFKFFEGEWQGTGE